MDLIHVHATCRACPWDDRTDMANIRGREHSQKNGHPVTVKTTFNTEFPAGQKTAQED